MATKKNTNTENTTKKENTKKEAVDNDKKEGKVSNVKKDEDKTKEVKEEEKNKQPTQEKKTETDKKATSEEKTKEEIIEEEKNFWHDALENISEGAKIAGEEAKSFTESFSVYSEKFWHVLKNKTSDIFKAGSELTKEAVGYAQTFAEKYKDRQEMKNLKEEKNEYAAKLGTDIYLTLKNNDNKLPDGYLDTKEVKTLLKHIEDMDKKILELSEQLSKS